MKHTSQPGPERAEEYDYNRRQQRRRGPSLHILTMQVPKAHAALEPGFRNLLHALNSMLTGVRAHPPYRNNIFSATPNPTRLQK